MSTILSLSLNVLNIKLIIDAYCGAPESIRVKSPFSLFSGACKIAKIPFSALIFAKKNWGRTPDPYLWHGEPSAPFTLAT